MPFTPFHFGPCAAIAIPLRRYIDLPVFLLTNVVIDMEVLFVAVLRLDAPLHGHLHSFTLGTVVALVFGCAAYRIRGAIAGAMTAVKYPYETSLRKMLFSSLIGVWLHVLLDAPLYTDIRPFFPSNWNPFYALISPEAAYSLCAVSFIPAGIIFGWVVWSSRMLKR